MSKRKSDFPVLQVINPFSEENFKKMVYPDWADRNKLMQWRIDNSKWLKDPSLIDLLDIDELITQWNVDPKERKCNPSTCHMVYKQLCLVLRLIDAEHQHALFTGTVPGVVYSKSSGKWLFKYIDLNSGSDKLKVMMRDTEEDAYFDYMVNRDSLIESSAAQGYVSGLIEEEFYHKYFDNANTIAVRPYEFYKKEKI